MEVDAATGHCNRKLMMEQIRKEWASYGYNLPNIVYWDVNARSNTILDNNAEGITYVSGSSPVLFQQIMKGVTAEQLMYDKLNSPRYKDIH